MTVPLESGLVPTLQIRKLSLETSRAVVIMPLEAGITLTGFHFLLADEKDEGRARGHSGQTRKEGLQAPGTLGPCTYLAFSVGQYLGL